MAAPHRGADWRRWHPARDTDPSRRRPGRGEAFRRARSRCRRLRSRSHGISRRRGHARPRGRVGGAGLRHPRPSPLPRVSAKLGRCGGYRSLTISGGGSKSAWLRSPRQRGSPRRSLSASATSRSIARSGASTAARRGERSSGCGSRVAVARAVCRAESIEPARGCRGGAPRTRRPACRHRRRRGCRAVGRSCLLGRLRPEMLGGARRGGNAWPASGKVPACLRS